MKKLTEKEKDVLRLAAHIEKGKHDELLFLLDKIHEVDVNLDFLKEQAMMLIEKVSKQEGPQGPKPSVDELLALIEPLIPEPIKGDDGDTYVLTAQDKADIARAIKVPVVERVVETIIEKTTVEQPIVTNEIREVAIAETAEQILEKVNDENAPLIKRDRIEGMDTLLERLKGLVGASSGRVAGGALRPRILKADCSAQCDGVNKAFSVGGTHFGILGVFSTEFPIVYRPIIDYTETNTGFILTAQVSAPQTGQTLVAQFLK